MNKVLGFSLIEVLIALLVLALGLLGLAGLQVTSLKNNLSAYNRSQATLLAYDLADRMRANVAAATTYTSTDPSKAIPQSACTTAPGCSPQNMAINDLFEWNSSLVSTGLSLVRGTITVTVNTVTGNIYSIEIIWDDDRDTILNDHTYITSFQL